MTKSPITIALDTFLEKTGTTRINAIAGNDVLAENGLLKQRPNRPGNYLRKELRNGTLPHAYKVNGIWFIPHS